MGDDARFTQEKVALLSVKANVPLFSKEAERADPLLRDEKTRRVPIIGTHRVFDLLFFSTLGFFNFKEVQFVKLTYYGSE